MVQRSFPSNTETEALLTDAVPSMRGSSKVPLMRTATSAVPDEKKSGEMPLSTRMFKSPLTFKLCLPPAAVASVPSSTMFVPGPVNLALSNATSLGVKRTTRGVVALS